MRRMVSKAIIAIGLAGLLPAAAQADVMLTASDNATVQPGGPRAGSNGKLFFNMEGSANNQFASFGVVDFTVPSTATAGGGVTGLTLALTQANAAFTANGALRFFVSEDTTTGIQPGTSPLTFQTSALPNGVGSQLSPLLSLGTGRFTEIRNGHEDDFSFSVSGGLAAYLTTAVQSHGDIRLVVAPDDATVAATYAGVTNSTPERLTLTTVPLTDLPEPASLAVLAGALGLLALRRRDCRVGT